LAWKLPFLASLLWFSSAPSGKCWDNT